MKKTGNSFQLFFVLAALLLGVKPVNAQVELVVSLDARQVLVQESFTWKLEVQGSDEMPSVRLPQIDKVALVSGPMQSSNYSYANGKMTSTKTLSYTFVALEAGNLTIPSMSVFLGQKRHQTKALSLEVVAAKRSGTDQGKEGASVFLRAIPSKRNIFLGEPLSVQYKLFTKVGVYNYQVDKLPDAVGFWAEEISQSSQPRLVSEVVDGERYNTAVLKTVLYYPTRSGELTIDPLSTELEIEVKSNQTRRKVFNDPFFNDPFFRGTQRGTRTFTSNPLKIQVKALPDPKPRSFSGAVGKFQIKASLDTNAVLSNDAVGLTISLSGSGNFKSIQVPTPNVPESVDVFKPERVEEITIRGMKHAGFKRSTYLLVPRQAGDIVIDPIEFTYYDLNAQKYITKSTGWIKLSVYDASGSQPVVTSGYSREEVALMQDDIRYIKAVPDKLINLRQTGLGLAFYLYHLAGVIILIALILFQRQQDRLRGNERLRRSTRAMSKAKTLLKRASKLPDESQELQTLLYQAIIGYIGARLHLAENSLELESLLLAMRNGSVGEETVSETKRILDGLTMDRFAPGAVKRSAHEWIEETQKLLQTLGRVL